MAELVRWEGGLLPDTFYGTKPALIGRTFVTAVNATSSMVWDTAVTDKWSARYLVSMPAIWPDASFSQFLALTANNSAIHARVNIAGTGNPGQVRLINLGGVESARSANSLITLNSTYRIEIQADGTAQKLRMAAFSLTSDTPIWDSGEFSVATGTTTARFVLGNSHVGASIPGNIGEMRFSDVLITDTYGAWLGAPELPTPVIPADTYVLDTFSRTIAAGQGWGAPDFGPAYVSSTTNPKVAGTTVDGTKVAISLAATSMNDVAFPITPVTDCSVTATITHNEVPVGGNVSVRLRSRLISSVGDYHFRIWFQPNGSLEAVLARSDFAYIGSTQVLVPVYELGRPYTIKMETYGVSPTNLRAKLWYADQPEPLTWAIERTDNTDGWQVPGYAGLRWLIGSGVTSTSHTGSFDNLIVKKPVLVAPPKIRYMGTNNFDSTSVTVSAIFDSSVTAATASLYRNGILVETKPYTISASKWANVQFTGLPSGVDFTVIPTVDDTTIPANTMITRTLPTAPVSYTFVTGSCQLTGSTHQVWDRIREASPLFVAHQGDLHYTDATTEAAFRVGHETSLTQAKFAQMAANVPINWTMDNHDRIITNPTGTGTGLNLGETDPATQLAWRELAGTSGWSSSNTIGRTWVAGRVRYIATDMWSVRDDGDGDPAPRTFLGPAQKVWLKSVLDSAEEPVVVWFTQWTARNNSNGRWQSFPEETDELEAFIDARPALKARMILMGGDSHSLQADDGSRLRADGYRFAGIPSLNISGFNRSGDAGDGSTGWSIANAGLRPTGDSESSYGAYHRTRITDSGAGSVVFSWEAVKVNLDGSQEVVAVFQKTFAAEFVPLDGNIPPLKDGTKQIVNIVVDGKIVEAIRSGDTLLWVKYPADTITGKFREVF